MRITIKDIEEAEKLAEKFGECHIASKGNQIWLVIDETRKRLKS